MFVILDKAFEGLSGLVGVPPDHLKVSSPSSTDPSVYTFR